MSTPAWTQRLKEHCQVRGIPEPVFQDVSDRRGGRTAWSTVVVVANTQYSARFWYDGAYVQQAKQDAAEIALRNLTGTVGTGQEPPPASYYVRA